MPYQSTAVLSVCNHGGHISRKDGKRTPRGVFLRRVAPRGAEICQRSCRAARLAPGLAHAAHAFHSLRALTAAFHAHAPVQNRAGIVGPVWPRAAQKFASALAAPHASHPATPMLPTPSTACGHSPQPSTPTHLCKIGRAHV